MSRDEILLHLALCEVGEPYIWGGQSPIDGVGFDCSGFVYYLLESIGLLPYGNDLTAQGIYDYFKDTVDDRMMTAVKQGDLCFWTNGDSIVHVEMCIGNGLCIGSSGGNSRTTTRSQAIVDGAMVRVRPITVRSGAIFLGTGDLV